ncbi:Transposase family Tnp2 protein [Ceratobasidium sp. AG-Ba]|nr:Transposase family Tnp2 protein [Ceratobasidium sp. AG-Ba]QRV99675.1 Transposase family Tnp2 protein [Ceratobasidium sp. AG-Ba]QRW14216.1 Transposase family Tnp2 protein [Ceratobasidium sp. AG-Ba]
MHEAMQLWRGAEDEIDEGPPQSKADWYASMDEDAPLTGVHDGWGWRVQTLGMARGYSEETGSYGDVVPDPPIALVRTRFGISFSINIDGFRAFKKGSYTKPNAYQYDQMLQPLVNDLVELARGVHMRVHQIQLGRAERELVHGHLHSVILDYMARIKNCGHRALASELDFCLYCKMRHSFISIPEGFEVEDYELRDPHAYLQAKYDWLEHPDQRNRLYKANGTRWTILDQVSGFYGNTSCPVDAMHVFSTGTTQWLVNQLIVASGMLGPLYAGQPEDEQPGARFNRGLSRVILPSFCSWIPPSLGKVTKSVKSEQWFHLVPLLPVLLYDAWRDGRAIPAICVPRGDKRTRAYKHQQRTAKLVLDHRRRIYQHCGDPEDPPPTLGDCHTSRHLLPFYRNCLRYCTGHSLIHDNSVSISSARLEIDLLSRCASTFARMNFHLSPNWHIGTHIEVFVHKYGCARNSWCFSCERANKVMINTHHNGHGLGTLETTMLRGYLKKMEIIRILRQLQAIPNPTEDDQATIQAILESMRTGPERETYRGMLDEVLAGEVIGTWDHEIF